MWRIFTKPTSENILKILILLEGDRNSNIGIWGNKGKNMGCTPQYYQYNLENNVHDKY